MKKVIIIFIFSIIELFSQQENQEYTITAELGGGYGRYFTTMEFEGLKINGFDGVLRVMWNPEHLLSVGVESGYHFLYSINRNVPSEEFGNSDLKLRLTSLPVALLVSMKVFPDNFPDFRLSGGTGVAILYSNGEFFNSPIDNSQVSNYYTLGANYTAELSGQISFGAEFKYSLYSKLEDASLSFLVFLNFKILSW